MNGHSGLRVKVKAVVVARNKIRRPAESQKVWLTFPRDTPNKEMMIRAIAKADSSGRRERGSNMGAAHSSLEGTTSGEH